MDVIARSHEIEWDPYARLSRTIVVVVPSVGVAISPDKESMRWLLSDSTPRNFKTQASRDFNHDTATVAALKVEFRFSREEGLV